MTDVRAGDLVKATHKKRPERTVTLRATYVSDNWVEDSEFAVERDAYDFEVLDRPAPPIDEELLTGAVDAYRRSLVPNGGKTEHLHPDTLREYKRDLTAVINYLRANDKKENYK